MMFFIYLFAGRRWAPEIGRFAVDVLLLVGLDFAYVHDEALPVPCHP